jgi:hypothetical protein
MGYSGVAAFVGTLTGDDSVVAQKSENARASPFRQQAVEVTLDACKERPANSCNSVR